jgi:cysteine synthase A
MKAQNVLATIGNTPHVRLARMFPDHEVWVKCERANPAGSVKDRIALAMVEAAEADGSLQPGGTIVEPTSGNTGIGLAMVAAVKGYRLILVMPESMSLERRRLMLAYGASFDLTPREKGMKGALERAAQIVSETPGAWMPQQFENPANVEIHARTTAREILADFAEDPIDVLVTGVGTGGHITACGEVLKQRWPQLKVYAVEPTLSPVISGGQPGPHPIQGIGAGFIPGNLHTQVIDGVIQVEADDAKEMARRSAREEGLLVGISSGGTLAAIAGRLGEFGPGKRILGFNYDTGERSPTSCRSERGAGAGRLCGRGAALDWVARPPCKPRPCRDPGLPDDRQPQPRGRAPRPDAGQGRLPGADRRLLRRAGGRFPPRARAGQGPAH